MNRLFVFTAIAALALVTGCKKEEVNPNISDAPPPATASAEPGTTGSSPAPGAPAKPEGVGAAPGQ